MADFNIQTWKLGKQDSFHQAESTTGVQPDDHMETDGDILRFSCF